MLILPFKSSPGNINMAEDYLMLQHSSNLQKICFRHYAWSEITYTFGYFQNYAWAKNIVKDKSCSLYRRPTGGGILSHENDWTYSLAIPSSHKDFRTKACEIYRKIHTAACTALNKQKIKTELLSCPDETQNNAIEGVCFTKAEPFDIIEANTRKKIAGAAMKRNQSAILLQGSIDKSNLNLNWNSFFTDFTNELYPVLETSLEFDSSPNHPQRMNLYKHFNSEDWNQRR